MKAFAEKIERQSRVILVLATVARVLLFVLLGLSVLLMISTWVSDDRPIFSLGSVRVYAAVPLSYLLGVDLGVDSAALSRVRLELAGQMAAFVLALILLKKIIRLFTRIRDSRDPFTADVIRLMKVFAVFLGLIVALQNTIVGVVVALAVFAFALIFEYGAELKNQVDETL